MIIDLKKVCKKNMITREDGEKINKRIVNAWGRSDLITVDFNNIQIASVSFIDEAFGKLAFCYDKEELKANLKFKNLDLYDRALLNDILHSRFHQKEAASEPRLKNKKSSIGSLKKIRKKALVKK